jgi:hypothetical protein
MQKAFRNWEQLKAFALDLNLPEVTEATSWGNPALKAHGKLWTWWSPYVDAALFKCDLNEREMLREADPQTFPVHPHYEAHNLILVAAGRIDPGWAEARLRRTWEDMAPKRVLKAWREAQGDNG